uniref:site-specific DNA-methyltransferase (cytosine-N(4)-specific) n=1 Tax=viral metagenome TaxID=1070528 RepID=A0A6M3IYD2_9ZZZZ
MAKSSKGSTFEYTLHTGDCRVVMAGMDANSVQCCVTSPPYYGLRDYGHGGQLGLESTPDEYVAKMVDVFRDVRRVLKDDGTLWLNLGDSYKNKNLIGIPWRVAFALQACGWCLRQDIIWHKPNPMPESVTDRCTNAHEYLFLLSKSARYFYEADEIKEASVCPAGTAGTWNGNTDFGLPGGVTRFAKPNLGGSIDGFRNRRSVWTVATHPFKGAHFATFPPKLIEPCILAGCPSGGVVFDPFMGSGTTGAVSLQHGRRFVGIDLNPEYVEIARRRIEHAINNPLERNPQSKASSERNTHGKKQQGFDI